MARDYRAQAHENSTAVGEEPYLEIEGKDDGPNKLTAEDNGDWSITNAIQTILSMVFNPADNSLRHTIVDESFQPIAKFFTTKILMGLGDVELFEDFKIEGRVTTVHRRGVKKSTLALGGGATTFAVDTGYMVVTADAGGNTIATITGGMAGEILILEFDTANACTITDDGTGTADTVNLSAAFTSSNNDTLTLLSDGTSWRELSRSVN